HLGVASTEKFMHFPNRVLGAALRSVTISTGFQVRLEDRLQHQLGSGLHHSVPYRRNPQRSFATPRLRYHHPSHSLRFISLGAELLPDLGQPLPQSFRFDLRQGLPIHPCRAPVGLHQFVGVVENVLSVDFVVEQVEAVFRFLLRLAIQLPLKRPDLARCFQTHRQSSHLGFFESAPEVRVLPSTGVARLRRYYDPPSLSPAALLSESGTPRT